MVFKISDPNTIQSLQQSHFTDEKNLPTKIKMTLYNVVLVKPILSSGRNAWSAGFWLKDATEKESVIQIEDKIRAIPEVATLRSELKVGKFIWAKCLRAGNQIQTEFKTKQGELKTYAEVPIKETLTVCLQTDSIWNNKTTPSDKFYRWTVTKVSI